MEHGFSEVIWGHILEGIFNMTSHQPLTKLFAVPLRRKRFAASPSPVQQLEADNRFQLQSLSFNRGRYTSTVSCTTSRCAQVRSRPPPLPEFNLRHKSLRLAKALGSLHPSRADFFSYRSQFGTKGLVVTLVSLIQDENLFGSVFLPFFVRRHNGISQDLDLGSFVNGQTVKPLESVPEFTLCHLCPHSLMLLSESEPRPFSPWVGLLLFLKNRNRHRNP